MADETQTWLNKDEASALEAYDVQRAQQAMDLWEQQQNEVEQAEQAMDRYMETGEVPEDTSPGFIETVKSSFKPAMESISRAVAGEGGVLDPVRQWAAEKDVEYAEPEAALQQLGHTIGGLFGVDIPDPDVWVEEPLKKRIEQLSQPLFYKDGTLNPEALQSSNLPRGEVNDLVIRSYANKYKLPKEFLEGLLTTRLGASPDDSIVTGALKTLGQTLDNVLFRLPSAIATAGYKQINRDVLDRVITRPKGEDFFDSRTIKTQILPKMRAIRTGKIDEITVNGIDIDVDPNDSIDTIQNKAYRENMISVLGAIENQAAEALPDVFSWVIPVAAPLKALLGVGKFAKAGSKINRISQIADKLPPLDKSATYLVNNRVVRKVAPELAAKVEQSKLADIGDYVLTQGVVMPAAGALGAPEGQRAETAVMMAGMTLPLAGFGLPFKTIESFNKFKKLESNVPLQKAIIRADSFEGLPRIMQTKMKQYYGDSAKPMFDWYKTLGQKLPEFMRNKMLQKSEGTLENVTPEFVNYMAKDPEIRAAINSMIKARGEDLSPVGLLAKNTLQRYKKEIGQKNATFQASDAPQALKLKNKKQSKMFGSKLNQIMERPDLLNDWQALFDYLDETGHPLRKQIRSQLQESDLTSIYERELKHLIEAGILQNASSAQFTDMINQGVFHSTNPAVNDIFQLLKADAEASLKGETSLAAKKILKDLQTNPDNVLELYDDLATLTQSYRKLSEAPKEYRDQTKAILTLNKELRKEYKNLDSQKRELNKIYEKTGKEYGLAKKALQADLDVLDKKIPEGLAQSPEFQMAREYFNLAMKGDKAIDPDYIAYVQKFVSNATEIGSKKALSGLLQAIEVYNRKREINKDTQGKYDLAVLEFLKLKDAFSSADSRPVKKFADVLVGLRIKKNEQGLGIAEFDIFSTISEFISRRDPIYTKILDSIPEFGEVVAQVSEEVAQGRPISAELRKQLRSYVLSDSAAMKVLNAMGDLRARDPEAISGIKNKMRDIEDILLLAEDTITQGKDVFEATATRIRERKDNLSEALPMFRKLKEHFNSPKFLKELDKLDSEIYPIFDKLLDGTKLSAYERKIFYKFITGTIGQQLYIHKNTPFLTTSRKQAEGVLKALQIHSGTVIEKLKTEYEKTFAKPMDTLEFISLYVNPGNGYNLNKDVEKIIRLASMKRAGNNASQALIRTGGNQEMVLDWIQDSIGRDIETAASELVTMYVEADKATRQFVNSRFDTLYGLSSSNGVKYADISSRPTFVELLKKGFGVFGLPDTLYSSTMDGAPYLTSYGEFVNGWIFRRLGRSKDKFMVDEFGLDWKDNPMLVQWSNSLDGYWVSNTIHGKQYKPEEWELMFKTLEWYKRFDYERVQLANSIIREMNARNGTTYPEYSYFPDRISIQRDKSRTKRDLFHFSSMDETSYDTLFGRHIETSKAGQLAKLEGISADGIIHPELAIGNETVALIQHAYTQHQKRLIDRQIFQLNDAGYYLHAGNLAEAVNSKKTEFEMVEESLPRQFNNLIVSTPGVGPIVAMFRPVSGIGWMLGRPVALLKSNVNGFSQAWQKAQDLPQALRIAYAPWRDAGTAIKNRLPSVAKIPLFIFEAGEHGPDLLMPALKVSAKPNLKWNMLELAKNPQEFFAKNLQYTPALGTMHGADIVGRLTERETNMVGLAKYRTYRTMPYLTSKGALRRALITWNTKMGAFYDGWMQRTKEFVEISQAKECYRSAMNYYDQSIQLAAQTRDPRAVSQLLIGPMEGLKNGAPFFRIAGELVNAVKQGNNATIRRLAEEYGLLYRNHFITRFDVHNYPLFLKNIANALPSAAQFYTALTNGVYRMINTARRAGRVPTGLQVGLFANFMATQIAQMELSDSIQDATGIEMSQWYVNPQAYSIYRYLRTRDAKDAIELENLLTGKMDIRGVELDILLRATYYFLLSTQGFSDTATAEERLAGKFYMDRAADQFLKITPYGWLADFLSSPVATYTILSSPMVEDVLNEAGLQADERNEAITLNRWIANLILEEGWQNTEDGLWWLNNDRVLNLINQSEYSPMLEYWTRIQKLTNEKAQVIDKSIRQKEFTEELSSILYWQLLQRKLGETSDKRPIQEEEPTLLNPPE